MKGTVIDISGKECRLYKDCKAEFVLIQPIDEHDLEILDQEVEIIKGLSDKPFSLVAFMIKDWTRNLHLGQHLQYSVRFLLAIGLLIPWNLSLANCCLWYKREHLMLYLAVILWLDYSHYGHLIRQTSLKESLLLLHQSGSPSGLNMLQITIL